MASEEPLCSSHSPRYTNSSSALSSQMLQEECSNNVVRWYLIPLKKLIHHFCSSSCFFKVSYKQTPLLSHYVDHMLVQLLWTLLEMKVLQFYIKCSIVFIYMLKLNLCIFLCNCGDIIMVNLL